MITTRGRAALRRIARLAWRGEYLVFTPALALAAYGLGGEAALAIAALAVPVLFALLMAVRPHGATPSPATPRSRDPIAARLDSCISHAATSDHRLACVVLLIDDAETLAWHLGPDAWGGVTQRCTDAMAAALRPDDSVMQADTAQLVVILAPTRHTDLEAVLQIAARLQDAVAQASKAPDGPGLTASVGFSLSSRAPGPGGAALLHAARTAARAARAAGPQALRAYSPRMDHPATSRPAPHVAPQAPDRGAIEVLFQPQLSTDTGQITGFAATARGWPGAGPGPHAPDARVWDDMVAEALAALAAWRRAGLAQMRVAVPCPAAALHETTLAKSLEWQLDRFEIAPDGLILALGSDAVAASGDDTAARNLSDLVRMGCHIDLEDFGSGRGAIVGVRRFAASRLKIDHALTARIDRDPNQRRMVTAILSMAEQLGLETLAGDVRSPGEHAVLAQLGCGHVQGSSVAAPMPFAETIAWSQAQARRLAQAQSLGDRIR